MVNGFGVIVVSAVFRLRPGPSMALPLFLSRIPAGFPSPADDYVEGQLDLNGLLVQHPAATFFVRVEGDSMQGAGIRSGDLLVVDRAVQPRHNDVVVASVCGELTVKRVCVSQRALRLKPENGEYPSVEITPEMEFSVWGVVTHVISKVR